MDESRHTFEVETRIRTLEERVREIERGVADLNDALRGDLRDLKNKPGAIALINRSIEASEVNGKKLDSIEKKVEGFTLDKAKVIGMIAASSVIFGGVFGIVFKLFLK